LKEKCTHYHIFLLEFFVLDETVLSLVHMERHSGLLVNMVESRLSGSGSSIKQGHCVVVFFGKRIHSHSATLYPGVQKGASNFDAGGNPAMDQHPIWEQVEIKETRISYWQYTKSLRTIMR